MKKLLFLLFIVPMGLLAQTKLDPIMIEPGMLTVIELHVESENAKIYVDENGNMVFNDPNAGVKTLSELISGEVQSDETLIGTGTDVEPLGVNTSTIATKTDLDSYWNKTEITETDKSNWNNKLDAEVDGDITNEIQTAQEVPITDTGAYFSSADVEGALQELGANISSGGDGWGTDVVNTDATLTGDGTSASPLSVVGGSTQVVAGNGITNNAGVFNLGGANLNSFNFDLGVSQGLIIASYAGDYIGVFDGGIEIETATGSNIYLQPDYAAFGQGGSYFNIQPSAGCYFLDERNIGLEYGADYSANFSDRSLVDKAYVDNAVSSAGGTNNSVQSLSGTAPGWDVTNGTNATITLSGNTTITLSNLSAGQTGNLTVTNAATTYTLGFSGYTVVVSPFIYSTGDEVTTSGNSLIDCFSWYYDGTRVIINGTLGYQ